MSMGDIFFLMKEFSDTSLLHMHFSVRYGALEQAAQGEGGVSYGDIQDPLRPIAGHLL